MVVDINKLINVPTSLNNSKTKVDDLDVGKLKTLPVDLKKLSDVSWLICVRFGLKPL